MSAGWIDALATRAGPMRDAALRWLGERGADASTLAAGPQGVAWLARELDRWLDDESVSEVDDHRFVDGAGAVLGLLLVEHAGDGRFEVRDGHALLRLGSDGWFDPFGCMERVLAAEAPRRELARSVSLAEAEARGDGPVARVVRAFREALGASRPELRIVDCFGPRVWLGPEPEVEVDLGRTVDATRDQPPAAVAAAVHKMVSMLPGSGATTVAFADVRPRLVPRLVGPTFLDALGGSRARADALVLEPLGHAVSVALLLSYDDRARYVRVTELAEWGVSASEARGIAIENLAARSTAARFARVDTPDGPLVVARTGDGLDAARLLLPTLHSVLRPELGDSFLVAVAHRDSLVAAPAGVPALAQALRRRAADDAARAPHSITDELFEVSENGLALFEPRT